MRLPFIILTIILFNVVNNLYSCRMVCSSLFFWWEIFLLMQLNSCKSCLSIPIVAFLWFDFPFSLFSFFFRLFSEPHQSCMNPLYEASLRLSGSTLLLHSLVDTNTLFSANPTRYEWLGSGSSRDDIGLDCTVYKEADIHLYCIVEPKTTVYEWCDLSVTVTSLERYRDTDSRSVWVIVTWTVSLSKLPPRH